MKNKPYTAFKSKNKVKNSLNFGFSHTLTFREYPKLATNGSQFGHSDAEPGTRCYMKYLGYSYEDFDLLLVTLSSLYTFVASPLVFGGFSKSSYDFYLILCVFPIRIERLFSTRYFSLGNLYLEGALK
jgi:hypothetical protein